MNDSSIMKDAYNPTGAENKNLCDESSINIKDALAIPNLNAIIAQ
jgi:hypothetical protein